jgi:hypothetical protein
VRGDQRKQQAQGPRAKGQGSRFKGAEKNGGAPIPRVSRFTSAWTPVVYASRGLLRTAPISRDGIGPKARSTSTKHHLLLAELAGDAISSAASTLKAARQSRCTLREYTRLMNSARLEPAGCWRFGRAA